MGITPYDNQSSINILYRYKSYNGYYLPHQAHNLFPAKSVVASATNNTLTGKPTYMSYKHGGHMGPSTRSDDSLQRDYELYQAVELRAKYFIHKRLELTGILPILMNKSRVSEEEIQSSGIGDVTFLIGYHVISRTMTERFQHRLVIGAGIKLPTGNYYSKAEDGDRIDFMLQTGTGSLDYLINLNYVFGFKKLGLNINSTYKINGVNYYAEQIGNSSTNYLNLFYKIRQEKDLKIFPSLQAYYEYTRGLYINNVYQSATKMNVLTSGIGLDVFYKNIALNMSFQLPLAEEEYKTNMATAGKFMLGLTYNFKQKKYLIHNKSNSES